MTIIDAIKKGLKAAGVNEKYAAKVQKLFKIEKEEDIDTYVALFKDNILPDLEDTSAVERARKDAIAEYEKNNGLKDGKPIKPVKKTKKTAKSEEDDEDEEDEDEYYDDYNEEKYYNKKNGINLKFSDYDEDEDSDFLSIISKLNNQYDEYGVYVKKK